MKGTVARLIRDKGFGFIKGEDNTEYFFHRSAVQGGRFEDLEDNQPVEFDAGSGPKGPRAENITTE